MLNHFLGLILGGLIRYALYVAEAIAVLLLVRTGRRHPTLADRWCRPFEVRLQRFAQHRGRSVVAVGLLALLLRAALLPILPPRLPAIADEHSYVLSGDTFALGRLTNPPQPMSGYFESPHVLQHPTYMSMYFPMQGLFLAAGKIVTGNQWYGVWLSVGLLCAALCWMLQGWLPPAWALLGGLIAVMRLALFSYWMNSFFGGAVSALGGALVLGALPRIKRRQRVFDAALLALGLAILLNSRPYEGFFLSLPVAGALLFWLLGKKRPPARIVVLRIVLPLVLILSITGIATCYYYWRVTGSLFQMPEALRIAQVMKAPYLIWQSPKPEPTYTNVALRTFHAETEMNHYLASRGIGGWLRSAVIGMRDAWVFYLGPVLTLPLIFLPRVLKDRRIRFLLVAGGVSLAGPLTGIWFYVHYAAPATAILYAILVQCIRHLRVCRWHPPAGVLLARGIPAICLLMVCARLAEQPLPGFMPLDYPFTWCFTRPGGTYRADILDRLRREGGKHLIFVRWKPGDNPYEQWVYNEPDVDQSTVVWAWEPEHPGELLHYYGDRRVWLLRVAWQGPPTLAPYVAR